MDFDSMHFSLIPFSLMFLVNCLEDEPVTSSVTEEEDSEEETEILDISDQLFCQGGICTENTTCQYHTRLIKTETERLKQKFNL